MPECRLRGRQPVVDGSREKLVPIAVPATRENQERIQTIYAFQSSLLQNVLDFSSDHSTIHVLTEAFSPSRPESLNRLTAAETLNILRQYVLFLDAAREWGLDFVDFSRFQISPEGEVRFAWKLDSQNLPSPADFIPRFNRCRHLRGLNARNYRDMCRNNAPPASFAESSLYLCRREDFASNLLHSRLPRTGRNGANVTVRIDTRFSWQKTVACGNLFHNLNNGETLLLHFDLGERTLDEQLAARCGSKPTRRKDSGALVREFGLFLKKSIFQEVVLVMDHLDRREDDRLLRYLLESEEVSGLIAVLIGDSAFGECDLKFTDNPPNLLVRHFPSRVRNRPALDRCESELLARFALLGVAVPGPVSDLLAGADGKAALTSLIAKGRLVEDRERKTLAAAERSEPAVADPPARNRLLATLAETCDWPYARIAHCIASDDMADLKGYLRKEAPKSLDRIAPGPAADLLGRFLPDLASDNPILEYGLDILIQGNCLELAAGVAARFRGRLPASLRLKKALLALRQKNYQELGRWLASVERPPDGSRDEWLYLNFMFNEKISQKGKAGEYARKIQSPYYRHLCAIQWSDRFIYQHDFARARPQLASALNFFSRENRLREEIETRNQMAKLLREEGDFEDAEAMYKTIYIEGEAGGLGVNAAAAAVDLGNLYLENDDDFQAECWYQKAKRLFARENHIDGLMLVNSNLVNTCVAKGVWLEADRLLGEILAWDTEKNLPDSLAIDLLNQAGLEALRLHDEKALELVGFAEAVFRASANGKALGECAFLRARLAGFVGGKPRVFPPGVDWFNHDQKTACRVVECAGRAGDRGEEASVFRELDGIRSRKIRFEVLRVLLKKYRRREWLDRFKEMAWELSPKTTNYFFYEYWYMLFDLAPEAPAPLPRDEFLAMYDFFTVNQRNMPAKFIRMRQQCVENGRGRGLFDDARLVERARHWRLPADFFQAFFHEIEKTAPIEWLVVSIHEKERPLFHFASSDTFAELGGEMLRTAPAAPREQNLELQEVRTRFRSPERFFYPFAGTKILHWPIADHLHARLILAFQDASLLFQNFTDRHRETFGKFSVLFQNFLQNEYRIQEKLEFIVGTSEKINELKRMIAQVSKVDFSLLITGESGSGKELVANAVHRLSRRADRPFVSLNAAAIPDTLLEAELFGYRKGAFSGAGEDRIGLLQAADHGTLFLDEIADLPLPLQAKLLRALQEREIRRLGENRTIRIDVRLISASNKDLGELVRGNLFRSDLFYRLQDLVIHLPPLRERREDIPPLVAFFLKKYGYPKPEPVKIDAIVDLLRHDEFPGNVRELESRIKSLITFHPDLDVSPSSQKIGSGLKDARQEFEKSFLRDTLTATGWRKGLAAEKLGISRMALFNLIKKYGISKWPHGC